MAGPGRCFLSITSGSWNIIHAAGDHIRFGLSLRKVILRSNLRMSHNISPSILQLRLFVVYKNQNKGSYFVAMQRFTQS